MMKEPVIENEERDLNTLYFIISDSNTDYWKINEWINKKEEPKYLIKSFIKHHTDFGSILTNAFYITNGEEYIAIHSNHIPFYVSNLHDLLMYKKGLLFDDDLTWTYIDQYHLYPIKLISAEESKKVLTSPITPYHAYELSKETPREEIALMYQENEEILMNEILSDRANTDSLWRLGMYTYLTKYWNQKKGE